MVESLKKLALVFNGNQFSLTSVELSNRATPFTNDGILSINASGADVPTITTLVDSN